MSDPTPQPVPQVPIPPAPAKTRTRPPVAPFDTAPPPADAVSVNGGPHTDDAVRGEDAEIERLQAELKAKMAARNATRPVPATTDPDAELHAAVLAAVEERLRTHPATKDMLGDRVGANPDGSGPAVHLSRGKLSAARDNKPGQAKRSRQADVRVRMTAPHKEQLPALCVAVQTALVTVAGFGPDDARVRQCVLLDTGKFAEEDGRHQRTDTLACFV